MDDLAQGSALCDAYLEAFRQMADDSFTTLFRSSTPPTEESLHREATQLRRLRRALLQDAENSPCSEVELVSLHRRLALYLQELGSDWELEAGRRRAELRHARVQQRIRQEQVEASKTLASWGLAALALVGSLLLVLHGLRVIVQQVNNPPGQHQTF